MWFLMFIAASALAYFFVFYWPPLLLWGLIVIMIAQECYEHRGWYRGGHGADNRSNS